jgi:hypothetical protein
VQVAVKVQYPGVGQALRSDLRQARLLARVAARLTRLNVSGLADELAGRLAEELDYVREGRVQAEVAAAFADRLPKELAAARAAGAPEPPGRTNITVPAVYAATPRVLITRWLNGAPLGRQVAEISAALSRSKPRAGPAARARVLRRARGQLARFGGPCVPWRGLAPGQLRRLVLLWGSIFRAPSPWASRWAWR